ncbi:MAG: NAD(P)/FAD-dependent oxidoreductase [Phycisphaerae bacterium]|nr:NAD(P)/FAD-dependent oxidoreductase [Saprospiraceae bacterium]
MENKTSHTPRVAVIGSGISGIASAAMLKKNGFQVEIYEKSDKIGGVWALAYPNVRLQNIAEQYHISDFPWPFKPDLHPTGIQILQYLQEAVKHFQLEVQLRHEITALQEEPDGWLASIQSPDGRREAHFDFVMVSNGHYSDGKNSLQFPDQDLYQGKVMTERDLKSLDEFKGKRVAVVGFGKSAVDMADFAAQQQAAQVFHVFRTPRWMFPRQ